MVTFLKTVQVAFELHALSSVRGKQATVKQLCFLFGCQYQLTSNSTQGGVGDNVRLTGSRELKKEKNMLHSVPGKVHPVLPSFQMLLSHFLSLQPFHQ